MKKIITVALLLVLCVLITVSVSAENATGNIYERDDITIQFKENSAFEDEEKQRIVDILLGDSESYETYNLICDLFSHKYESEIVSSTTHNVRNTAPKCLLERYNVSVCSRCGATKTEFISSEYINCHK